jgi:hypothetical protein
VKQSLAAPLIAVVFLVVLGLGAFTFYEMKRGEAENQARRTYQLESCERGKLDRADHLAVYAAMAEYYEGVLAARSVKEDVKRSARRIHAAVSGARDGLKSRILLCEPLVDDNQRIPDYRILKRLALISTR